MQPKTIIKAFLKKSYQFIFVEKGIAQTRLRSHPFIPQTFVACFTSGNPGEKSIAVSIGSTVVSAGTIVISFPPDRSYTFALQKKFLNGIVLPRKNIEPKFSMREKDEGRRDGDGESGVAFFESCVFSAAFGQGEGTVGGGGGGGGRVHHYVVMLH